MRVTRQKLAEFLRNLATLVESGDSLEGRVIYSVPDGTSQSLEVFGRVRAGNLDGQGGVIVLDEEP